MLTFRKEKYLFAARLKLISKKCTLLRFLSMMIENPSFLNYAVTSFLILSSFGPFLLFIVASLLSLGNTNNQVADGSYITSIYLYFVYIELSLYMYVFILYILSLNILGKHFVKLKFETEQFCSVLKLSEPSRMSAVKCVLFLLVLLKIVWKSL